MLMSLKTRAKELLFSNPLYMQVFKPRAELGYWRQHLNEWIPEWYAGRRAFHFPFPTEEEKEKSFDPKTNAFLTYMRAELRQAPYLSDLGLNPRSFAGMRVADIGCGPYPNLLVFEDCERWGFDHLIDAYRRLGYPLERFDVRFVNCKTEKIPMGDAFFDAVISRNAIDHVDDFEQTAREMRRILKPGGYLVIQTHYHRPTTAEPLVLDDERVLAAFGSLGIKKISTVVGEWGFEEGHQTVVWSNMPEAAARPAGLLRRGDGGLRGGTSAGRRREAVDGVVVAQEDRLDEVGLRPGSIEPRVEVEDDHLARAGLVGAPRALGDPIHYLPLEGVEKEEDDRLVRDRVGGGVDAHRLDRRDDPGVAPDSLQVLGRHPMQLGRELDPHDPPEGKAGGDDQRPTLSRAEIEEDEALEVDAQAPDGLREPRGFDAPVRRAVLAVAARDLEAVEVEQAARVHAEALIELAIDARPAAPLPAALGRLLQGPVDDLVLDLAERLEDASARRHAAQFVERSDHHRSRALALPQRASRAPAPPKRSSTTRWPTLASPSPRRRRASPCL